MQFVFCINIGMKSCYFFKILPTDYKPNRHKLCRRSSFIWDVKNSVSRNATISLSSFSAIFGILFGNIFLFIFFFGFFLIFVNENTPFFITHIYFSSSSIPKKERNDNHNLPVWIYATRDLSF